MSDVNVLYILGWDRSGSTILGLVLGATEGFFDAGEVHHLWRRGILEGRACGCGSPVMECPVWGQVIRGVHKGTPELADVRAVIETHARRLRVRTTWRLLRTRGSGLESYLSLMRRVYGEMARATGAEVIVDTSKDASDAAILTLLPGVRPYFVHLVRDPRATAFSMSQRPKPQPDLRERRPMTRQAVARSTVNWVLWNLAAERVRHELSNAQSMLLRYEDFVADPAGTVRRITAAVGRGDAATPFVDRRTARLGQNHTVSGNPSRFSSGMVTITGGEEWHREQSRLDRLIATAVASPLIKRYGYAPAPGRADA